MNKNEEKFISEIIKPWESLNKDLNKPFSMNPEINDFITKAKYLANVIKHFPESTMNIKPKTLVAGSLDYSIISDLADSIKHGALHNTQRECNLSISSMFERNKDSKVRFLRNRILIEHKTHGKVDFMQCSANSAIYVMQKTIIKTDWMPKVLNNQGEFLDEIKVHASKNNQINWQGMIIETVKLNDKNEFENDDLSGSVKITVTSEF